MKELFNIISNYNNEIIVGLCVVSLLLLLINIISQMRISKIKKNYDALVKGVDRENLEKLVLDLKSKLTVLNSTVEIEQSNIKKIESKLAFAVQKVEVLRYDAFSEMGSEQSFSLALLDEGNTGVIITNIFARDYSSNYIKPIEKGNSKYQLSKEEEVILNRAINK